MAFLCSSPQIGTMQSLCIQLYRDFSGTCGLGAYLDGAWFRGNCPHQCLKSSERLLETPPPQSCGPFSVHHLQGRMRNYYAFCHKFNLTTLPQNQALHQPFLSQTGSEEGSSMGEGSLSKWACLPLLTSCLEAVGTW